MTRFNRKIWMAALGAGAVASGIMLPSVHAELVYENGTTEPTQLQSQVDDRAALRQTLQSSEKAQATIQAQQQPVQVQTLSPAPVVAAAPATAPLGAAPAVAPAVSGMAAASAAPVPVPAPAVVVSQPAVADASLPAASSSQETPNLSHAEMLRRERMREELKNEDVLQTRLEELRLKDEEKRTGLILAPVPTGQEAATGAGSAPAVAPLHEQAVVAPVTEHPGQPAPVVAPLPTQGQQVASVQSMATMDQAGAVGTSTARLSDDSKDKTVFGITARGGLSNMSSNNMGYSISPQFSAGVAGSMAVTDYVSLELGYTYSQYSVSMPTSNPFVSELMNSGYGSNGLQSLQLNQNVIDAGAKISLLGPDSKIRPFVSGGLAYSKGYVNYSQSLLSYINSNPGLQSMGTDYDLTQYLGYVGAGVDVKITRSVSLGVDFKYYDVLSSDQNNSLNNYAFYGNPYGLGGPTTDKQYVGGSLASANFYSVLAGLTFNM